MAAGSTWHHTRGERRSKPACGSACSFGAVIFADRVARVAPVACVALVTLQATVLLVPVGRVATLDVPPTTATDTVWRLPPPEIYELSSTRNLIHIVLDTFPTHTFADILDADRPAFDRDWPGFTFFANHLGTHRNTFLSMPAMLSGVAYRNEMPIRQFLTYHPSIFHTLGRQGTLEAIITALFLLAATRLVRDGTEVNARRFRRVALAGGIATFFSVPAVFVTFPVVNLGALYAVRTWIQRRQSVRSILWSAAAYNGMVAAAWWLLRSRSNPGIRGRFAGRIHAGRLGGCGLDLPGRSGRSTADDQPARMD